MTRRFRGQDARHRVQHRLRRRPARRPQPLHAGQGGARRRGHPPRRPGRRPRHPQQQDQADRHPGDRRLARLRRRARGHVVP